MNILKKIFKKIVKRLFYMGNYDLAQKVSNIEKNLLRSESSLSQIEQRRLFLYYQQLYSEGKFLPHIKDVGFRNFSQNDEDGILLYLFSLLGTTNKLCVDIAFASPYGANTTNLICNWGWSGLLVCGSEKEKVASEKFFSSNLDTWISMPKVEKCWVTAENINELLLKNGVKGEIDLFSLDIDGVDYWIWKSLEVANPRVVVVEFQSIWGNERAVTVPYSPDFDRFKIHEDFYGASLPAFVKLAAGKGYRLVGFNKYGFNAFFVRNDLGKNIIPTLTIEDSLNIYKQSSWSDQTRDKRLAGIRDMFWFAV